MRLREQRHVTVGGRTNILGSRAGYTWKLQPTILPRAPLGAPAPTLTPADTSNESKPNQHYRDRIVRAIEFKPGALTLPIPLSLSRPLPLPFLFLR